MLPISPKPLDDFAIEYGALECNVEVVDSLQDAVQVIVLQKSPILINISYLLSSKAVQFMACRIQGCRLQGCKQFYFIYLDNGVILRPTFGCLYLARKSYSLVCLRKYCINARRMLQVLLISFCYYIRGDQGQLYYFVKLDL